MFFLENIYLQRGQYSVYGLASSHWPRRLLLHKFSVKCTVWKAYRSESSLFNKYFPALEDMLDADKAYKHE